MRAASAIIVPAVLATALLLTGCGGIGLPEDRRGAPAETMPQPGRLAPVLLNRVRVDIPRGTDFGGYEFGLLCAPPYQRLGWTTARQLLSDAQGTVEDGLAEGGLDVAGQARRPFEVEEDMQRAEMQVAGRVTGLRVALCNRVNWLTGWSEGASGEAVVRVEWSLFDRLTRRTLATEVTEGRGETDGATLDGEFSAVHAALYDAAARFARSPRLRLRLSRDGGARPQRAEAQPGADGVDPWPDDTPGPARWSTGADLAEGAGGMAGERDIADLDDASPGLPPARSMPALSTEVPPAALPADDRSSGRRDRAAPDGQDAPGVSASPDAVHLGARWPALAIPALPPYAAPLAGRAERVQAGGVMVAAGAGHGSGFFIADGLVLTNAHVVGHAARVRVVTADGTALVGTVERREPMRDVALVRVPRGGWPPMPLRLARPRVSEDVFALGAPLLERHSGTLTRGIVSAWRTREGGQLFLQADVAIQPGSSGGPLMDGHGNVIGLTVSGVGETDHGINYFIPIPEALERLGIVLKAAGTAADGQ
ncbi:S1 family peptidase [Indioceanicola profundi]|uniref:S1 family peptidase n=1 Tax=Indioceanicola profundi TaxID=2220096 RepID=UPI000E6AD4E4|nr:serine protease [Indioceanicola profundi]